MNLLTQEILAEVTVFLMNNGQRKSIISKIEDDANRTLRQQVVQALIFAAIDVAKERAIGINWQGLSQLYPYQGPPAAAPAPAPAPSG